MAARGTASTACARTYVPPRRVHVRTYLVELRGGDGTQLALKVLIDTLAGDQSLRIHEEQMAEYVLLQDSARLPPHPNILSVLHSFVDVASSRALPGTSTPTLSPHVPASS